MRCIPWTAFVLAGAFASAEGATVTVTTASDTVDIDWQTATIADLPGPDGVVSFSEAMIATNNTPGHDIVGFAIPQSEWILQFILPGRAVLTSLTGFYFSSSDEVTIDGFTQTAFTGDTNPGGCEVAIYGTTLGIGGDNSTFIGFDSTSVGIGGSNCFIDGNTGAMNITVGGGSGSIISNNTGGTIKIDRSSDNIVIGNTVTRVRVLGGGPPAMNNRVGGPTLEERNFITGYGTFTGEGCPSGWTVQIFDSIGTVIENNWIGTTPDGLASGSDASVIGVGFGGENHDAIIRNNRIAGIRGIGRGPSCFGRTWGDGIRVEGIGSGITIQGNTIGLDANDEALLGSVSGILLSDYPGGQVTDVVIGGQGAGEGNVIAGHLIDGITVEHPYTGATISGNSVYANAWLGIDLRELGNVTGITLNDPLDLDTGANDLQNYPVLDGAVATPSSVTISGALDSSVLRDYALEFFASAMCDDSGAGQGERYLGATNVTTDSGGFASFVASFPATVGESEVVTATATDLTTGSTSEFSLCVDVEAGAVCAGDADGNGVLDVNDIAFVIFRLGFVAPADQGADVDGNGIVDINDIANVIFRMGNTCP